jgi:LytR cell envelope-related transcriptional attenuator
MRGVGRGWTWAAGVVGVSAAVVIPILGVVAARTLGDSTSGTLDSTGVASVAPTAETPGALLVATDGSEVVGLAVLALSPSGSGGTVVVVPAGSVASVDGIDHPTRLAAAFGQGGMDAQVTATEGMLGVTFSASQQVDEAGMRALFEPLAPIPVDLPDAVDRPATATAPAVQLPTGPQELTAEQAAAALFARTPNESEIVRLPIHLAVWNGVVSASRRVAKAASDGVPQDVAGFLAAIGAGPDTAVGPTVSPLLDTVSNPDGVDLLQLDKVDLRLLMARILPTAASPTGSGLRVRLSNHSGDATALREAAARLQFVGATIVAIDDTPAPPAKETAVRYDPSLNADQLTVLNPAVGEVAATPAAQRIDGIDVTVDLGQDFLTFLTTAADGTSGAVPTTNGVASSTSGG